MHVTTTAPHKSSYPDPIEFAPGDALRLGRRDAEYAGWVWVTTPAGSEGWAPEAYIEVRSKTEGLATETYTARELDTVEGQRLHVHKELAGWLWVEDESGQRGWVPRATTSLGG